jgi:hypothetical protein
MLALWQVVWLSLPVGQQDRAKKPVFKLCLLLQCPFCPLQPSLYL